ncbi:hypothetical protein CMI37_11585 [Candidatus Pacearchaeota archaeon]|nr:hypothetical protein [Candidatus Pacearchaeota archaeon]
MNKSAKGHRNELKAKKILENSGYNVVKKVHTRHDPGDFFGIFDLMAVNQNGWRLIQVKSNKREKPAEREEIELFTVPINSTKEVWVFKDRIKEPIIHVL